MDNDIIYFYERTSESNKPFRLHKHRRKSSRWSQQKNDEAGPSMDNDEERKSPHNQGNPTNLPDSSQPGVTGPSEIAKERVYESLRPVTAATGAGAGAVAGNQAGNERVKHDNDELIDDDDTSSHIFVDRDDLRTKGKIQDMLLYAYFLSASFLVAFWSSSSSAYFMSNAMTRGFMETPFLKVDNTTFPVMPVFPTPTPSTPPETTKPTKPTSKTTIPTKKPTTLKPRRRMLSARSQLHNPYLDNTRRFEDEDDPNRPDWDDYDLDDFIFKSSRRLADEEPKGGFAGGSDPAPLSLKDSVTLADFWDFAETTLLNLLYWDFWYSYRNPTVHVEKEDQLMFYSSQLLGVPRMRQLAVRPDSCSVHDHVQHLFKSCYGYYSASNEKTENIVHVNPITETNNAWIFTPGDELETLSYSGIFSTYGRGGYVLDFAMDRAASEKRIQELKNNLWINRGTRAIIIDFTVYNANVNLFIVAKIVVEIPPTGGIYPISNFQAMKFFRYVSTADFVVLGFEAVLIFFVIYYTAMTAVAMSTLKLQYLRNSWHYLDIITLTLSYVCIGLGFYRYFVIEPQVADLIKLKTEHPQFDYPRAFQTSCDQCSAVLLFFVFLKIFRFLRFNSTVDELSRTLLLGLQSILIFAAMFFIFFMAFALMAFQIFGSKVSEYRTVWASTTTLFQAILGKFNYQALEEADYVLGPIFLFLFVFFIFFLLINMFIAIMIESYRTIRAQVIPVRQKKVTQYWARAFGKVFPCMARKNTSDEGITMVNKIADNLRRAGFTENEIEIFFAKYEIKTHRDITEESAQRLITKLELRKYDFEPVVPDVKTVIELHKEVERLNGAIRNIEKKLVREHQD